MLNKETRKKIDNCRNILVGVLPLPTDQVELITIALIYKFMDDMDEQSLQLGGNPAFFRNGLKEFSWQNLMSNQLGGNERVQLFVNALEEFAKAPHLLEFFKSIFRNTFLKFRDGRVFKLFLDEINYFSYNNSEELGNAFEYLLNTMGTQGENGQFRTPRNIIDFIVEVVDPDKDDKILDPACGTAGFLISAYKHILRKYTTGYENYRISLNNQTLESNGIHWGDKLLAAQKSKLSKRIEGYDNTPLMVRLSQVNMYLHNFPNPAIYDYDTLTYTNRWNDKYDCILANPPFMSPKGGVKPNDQFRIRANKTEVLFSDYIIEHLTPNGKAGWIVPEGIIFTNSNDYVELRKWLINDLGLWAVVSLPAQIFQPYSGVKTSILLVDRALSRLTENIILVKIENDGFSLNTNRNPIKDNDLPVALNILTEYKKNLSVIPDEMRKLKHKILHRKDFAKLDSYKSTIAAIDFCKKEFNILIKAEEKYQKSIEIELRGKQKQKADERIKNIRQTFLINTGFNSIPPDENSIKQFVEDQLKGEIILYGENFEYYPNLSHNLKKYIDWQREYNLSIDKYFQSNEIQTRYESKRLDECIEEFNYPNKVQSRYYLEIGKYPIVDQSEKFIAGYTNDESYLINIYKPVIIFGDHTRIVKYIDFNFCLGADGVKVLVPTENLLSKYFYYVLRNVEVQNLGYSRHFKLLREKQIPLPPLEVQQKIVSEIEKYQKVVEQCKRLKIQTEKKIKEVINSVWLSNSPEASK
jgi:type I restriction enzyme M protein